LNLAINQVNVQVGEQEITPAILFSGNLNYPLSGNTNTEKIQDLRQVIGNWQNDVKTFQDLLGEKFLPSATQGQLVSSSVFLN
jgi:hypothetical protein